METIDHTDARLLTALQRDATLSMDALADIVGRSRNAVWRRMRILEEAGVIRGRVVLLDPARLGLGLQVFMQIRTGSHDPDWQRRFAEATRAIRGILSVYRMTGDLDYLIRARVPDMAGYDALYRQLTERVAIADVSASFVMEEIKDSTALPL